MNHIQLAQLRKTLASLIDECDRFDDVAPEVRVQMIDSLEAFVEAAIKKFVNGQREHGGNLASRDLDAEIRAETIDLFWYGAAKGWPKTINNH